MQNLHAKLNPGLSLQTQHQQTGLPFLLRYDAVGSRIETWCNAMRRRRVALFDVFARYVLYMLFSAVLHHSLCQGYQHFEAGCLGLKLHTSRHFQNRKTATERTTFWNPSLFPFVSSSVMVLRRSVTKDGNHLCDYIQMHILTSDDCETAVLDSDSDSGTPTTLPRRWFRFFP